MNVELKTVRYRGGLVTFRIPAHWEEEHDPEGGGAFYEPVDDSPTLRLNVLTFQGPAVDDETALSALRKTHGDAEPVRLGPRHAIVRTREDVLEAGEALAIVRWEIAQAVAPDRLRLVVFSLTLLARQEQDVEVKALLGLLDRELRGAQLALEAGS